MSRRRAGDEAWTAPASRKAKGGSRPTASSARRTCLRSTRAPRRRPRRRRSKRSRRWTAPPVAATASRRSWRRRGSGVSLITIPKILNGTGLGTRPDRWLALKAKHADEAIKLRAEQIASLEKPPPSPSRKTREIRRIGQLAFRRHLRPRHTQWRRHGLSARGGRHLWQLRPRLASPVSNPPEGETQAPLMEGMAPAPPASQCAVVGAVILIHEGRHP